MLSRSYVKFEKYKINILYRLSVAWVPCRSWNDNWLKWRRLVWGAHGRPARGLPFTSETLNHFKCFDFSTFILHEGIPQTTLQRKNTLNGTPATSQDAAFIVEVIPESLEAAADVTMALRLQLGRLKVLHLTSQS